MNRCLEKKSAKYLKREEKAAAAADRVTMKEEINALKQEKAEVKVSYRLKGDLQAFSGTAGPYQSSQLKMNSVGRAQQVQGSL